MILGPLGRNIVPRFQDTWTNWAMVKTPGIKLRSRRDIMNPCLCHSRGILSMAHLGSMLPRLLLVTHSRTLGCARGWQAILRSATQLSPHEGSLKVPECHRLGAVGGAILQAPNAQTCDFECRDGFKKAACSTLAKPGRQDSYEVFKDPGQVYSSLKYLFPLVKEDGGPVDPLQFLQYRSEYHP